MDSSLLCFSFFFLCNLIKLFHIDLMHLHKILVLAFINTLITLPAHTQTDKRGTGSVTKLDTHSLFHFRCVATPTSHHYRTRTRTRRYVRCPAAVAVWFFNETLKYNLWILMSCQMMPKRWFSIIINTTMPAHQPQHQQQHHHQQQQQQQGCLSVCTECKMKGLSKRPEETLAARRRKVASMQMLVTLSH